MSSSSALRLAGVTRRYDELTVLDGVDLAVAEGEVVALVGLNGAGKTSLLRTALGMLRPHEGRVEVFGVDVFSPGGRPDWSLVGHQVDTGNGYPELTVDENLWVAAMARGLQRERIGEAVDGVVDGFVLQPVRRRRAGVLSLGNRQRLGLAMAFVHSPQLLVLDEPVNGLDPVAVVHLRDLLRAVADAGAAVLVSSHHLDEVARVADRIDVLHRGLLIGQLPVRRQLMERAFFAMVHNFDVDHPEGELL